MSHVLANRWRPQALNEVIGQQNTVKALTNALNNQQLHHSYLFTGTRGVGKTSLARLFAQGLNCAEGISATPCKRCDSCIGIIQGADLDFYEIDAASRTKVEETLKILEMAHYPPTRSKFKIFLIDEVHMLSNHSFNALLKTLEQPPKNILFLLATTEPMRIPDTVRSRCLQFALSPVDGQIIGEHLAYVTVQEQRSIDQAAIDLLVEVAHGSVRDAMTALQQVMLQSEQNPINVETTQHALGLISVALFNQLFTALNAKDIQAVQSLTQSISSQLQQKGAVIDQWLSFLNQHIWQANDPANIQNWIQIALLTKRDLGLYPNIKMAFDVMLARTLFCVPATAKNWLTDEVKISHTTKEALINPIADIRSSVEAKPATTTDTIPSTRPEQSPRSGSTTEIQSSASLKLSADTWASVVKRLQLTGLVNQLAEHIAFETYEHPCLAFTLLKTKASLLNERNQKTLEQKLQTDFPGLKLSITLIEDAADTNDTLHTQQKKADGAKVKALNEAIHENTDVKRIQTMLCAEIIEHKQKD